MTLYEKKKTCLFEYITKWTYFGMVLTNLLKNTHDRIISNHFRIFASLSEAKMEFVKQAIYNLLPPQGLDRLQNCVKLQFWGHGLPTNRIWSHSGLYKKDLGFPGGQL